MNIIAANVYKIAKAIGGKEAGMVAKATIKSGVGRHSLKDIMTLSFKEIKEAEHIAASSNGKVLYLRAKGFAKSIVYVPLNALKAIGKKIPGIKSLIKDTATIAE